MHLKNCIVFFCVTLNFYQFEGAPTDDELNKIKDIVTLNLEEDGKMDIGRVMDVIGQAAKAVNIKTKIAHVEDTDIVSRYTFSNDEVEINLLSFVAEAKPGIKMLVQLIVTENMPQDEVDFSQLRAICTNIGEMYLNITKDFLSIDVFRRTSLHSNRKFTRRGVEMFALAFIGSEEPGIYETIKSEVENYDNRDEKSYEDFKNIFKRVQEKHASVAMEFPSNEKFLEEQEKTRYDAEEVKAIIVEYLFTMPV